MEVEMTTLNVAITPRVTEALGAVQRFTALERLALAKLLLDSLLMDEATDETDWQKLSLAAFEQEWDNPDDAIYDNWRELYGVQPG
jgi:hypothetical protein